MGRCSLNHGLITRRFHNILHLFLFDMYALASVAVKVLEMNVPSLISICSVSSLSGPLVHHTQDNLASCVPSRSLFVRLARLGKGQYRLDDRSNLSRINQCANLDQLLPVGFDHKPDWAHAMCLRLFKRGSWADNGDKHPSWFHHLPGSLQGVTTNCIEDEINIMNHLLEARGGVVDDLVGSQVTQEVAIACRGGRDDMRPCPMSKLDGKDSNAPCRSVDQDGLSCNEARVIKESLPGRQSCQGNGCRLHMVEGAWLGGQLAGQGNGIFRLGTVAIKGREGINL